MRRALGVAVFLACAPPVVHADGMLDPAFGNGGVVVTAFGDEESEVQALVPLPDGRIVAAGSGGPLLQEFRMAVARYLPSGALDPSFDGDGRVTIQFGAPHIVVGGARAALLQPDGRIVLVGGTTAGTSVHYALARINEDGSLDSSFGTAGQATSPLANGYLAGLAAALLPDGRILALGVTGTAGSPGLALARFNSDGTADATFGVSGHVTVALPLPFGFNGLVAAPDGRIVITGSVVNGSQRDLGVVRLRPDGSLDPSFDGDGFASLPIGRFAVGNSVVITTGDRILVGGYAETTPSGRDLVAVRYLTNGTLDGSFGVGGLAAAHSDSMVEFGGRVAVQPDGKIMLGGTEGFAYDFVLARLNADGTIDPSFGENGFIRTDLGARDPSWALALPGPDRILVAGSTGDELMFFHDFALARYIAATPVELLTFGVE